VTVDALEHTELAVAVRGLRVELTDGVDIVDDISFEVESARVLALVGESGCGKTATGMAMLGFARPGTRIARGEVVVGGTDILQLSPAALRRACGSLISYVPQDPSTSLNPSHRIGTQIAEMLEVHGLRGRARIRTSVEELLQLVQLPADRDFQQRYPHQLSGGQQQRVAIAMALACEPKLVVLDEPTSALDMTVQVQIVELLRRLQAKHGLAYIFISHDLRVVRALAHQVVVMQNGDVVETGDSASLFAAPATEYTRTLLAAAFDLEPAPVGDSGRASAR
jgi:ABC-type glutathione transport system ATPase component